MVIEILPHNFSEPYDLISKPFLEPSGDGSKNLSWKLAFSFLRTYLCDNPAYSTTVSKVVVHHVYVTNSCDELNIEFAKELFIKECHSLFLFLVKLDSS